MNRWDGYNEHLTDEVDLLPSGVDPRDIETDVVDLTVELGRYTWYIYQPQAPMNRVARAVIGSKWLADHDRVVAANAWDEGFKQGGPMHDADMNDPDAHKNNPYRAEEEKP